jgi:hypothetical protein
VFANPSAKSPNVDAMNVDAMNVGRINERSEGSDDDITMHRDIQPSSDPLRLIRPTFGPTYIPVG